MTAEPASPEPPASGSRAGRFNERLRVRWAEVDLQQVVFNGHYLMYLDTAMAGYWRALALPYQQTMAALEGDLYVRKAMLEYHGSARYDDLLDITLRCARIGRSSIVFDAGVLRAGERLVDGELVYVYVNAGDRRPAPVPDALRAALTRFEDGGDRLALRWGGWASAGPAVTALRAAGVRASPVAAPGPADEAVANHADAAVANAVDEAAWHGVVCNALGAAVGSVRLVAAAGDLDARIERLTVHPALQGAGIGRALVDAAVSVASERGCSRAIVVAAEDTAAFYRRLHFEPTGNALAHDGGGESLFVRRLDRPTAQLSEDETGRHTDDPIGERGDAARSRKATAPAGEGGDAPSAGRNPDPAGPRHG